jgi:hypothetical protein
VWRLKLNSNMTISTKTTLRNSTPQGTPAILVALLILLCAAPQSSLASLVIILYQNEVLYIGSDSALTSVESGERIGTVKKTFRVAENCCVAMTGSASYDIDTTSGKTFASLNFLKLLQKLSTSQLTNPASLDRKIESIATGMNEAYCSLRTNGWGKMSATSIHAAEGTVVVLPTYTTEPVSVTNVPVGLTNMVAVAAGLDDALALRDDGTVVAWGAGDNGITNVPATATNVMAISSGWLFHMALRGDGTVVTWGDPSTAVPPGLSNVVAIAAGGHQFCPALMADRTVTSWGWNGYGQTNVPEGLTNVIAVAAGLDHSLALREDGTVVAWGDNTFGAVAVPTNLADVVAIAAGWSQSYGLRADGTVVGWGTSATNLPANLTNVAVVAGGWDAGKQLLLQDGTLLWNYGMTNVMAVARGHFFAVALTVTGGPAALSLPLAAPSWMAGRFGASIATRYGRVYAPQYRDNMVDAHWTALRLLAGKGQMLRFEDPTAIVPQRFYRVIGW